MAKKNKIYAIYGMMLILVLISIGLFTNPFAVAKNYISESEKNDIMDDYDRLGYICSEEDGNSIKYTNCQVGQFTSGAYNGLYQIICSNYQWTDCSNPVTNDAVYCYFQNYCEVDLSGSCNIGKEFDTAYDCGVWKVRVDGKCDWSSTPDKDECDDLKQDMYEGKNDCWDDDLTDCYDDWVENEQTTTTTTTSTTQGQVTTTTQYVPTTTTLQPPVIPPVIEPPVCGFYEALDEGKCTITQTYMIGSIVFVFLILLIIALIVIKNKRK